ncbi:MAG: tetratricopeptide repeat protein [Acidobacteriota bacterium]|nr:tetratricopeptide repeat protein [Acidobacteriota bacterium]
MSRTLDDAFKTEGVLDPSAGFRSRDSVIESIVRLNEDEASSVVGDREHQLRRLVQTLRNRKNHFALIFVVCNEVPLRRTLTQEVKEKLPDQDLFEFYLTGKETEFLDSLLKTPGTPHPLFVYGLENLLPSSVEENLRREETLQELQLRREQFRNLKRPLVLWMPEYVYTLIGQQAVDFWSWQSGTFFFTEIQSRKVASNQDRNIDGRFGKKIGESRLKQLPATPRDFIGREAELDDLRQALRRGLRILGVQGMGGVGKTALALKLAHEFKDQYADAQIYLDFKGVGPQPLSPAEVMWHVVSSFQPEMKRPDDDQLPAWYNSLLDDKRVLLFYDNAKNAAQIAPLLPPKHCLLLVTSRKHFTLRGMFDKNLDEMTEADAEKLLLRIAPQIGRHATSMAEQCGYLPIALCAAASALKAKRSLSPEDYLKRLRDNKERLKLRDEVRELTVEACFSLSYELLNEELQRRWRMLAIFPTDFDAPAAAAVWQTDVDAAKHTLAELEEYSLLEWEETARRYSLHDLARDFADTRLSVTEREQAGLLHSAHYLQILSTAGDLYLKGSETIAEGLSLFDNERINIEAGQEWAATRFAGDDQAAQLCNRYAYAGVYVLNLRQHPHAFIHWQESALHAARKLRNRQSEGNHLGNLGNAYADLGEVRTAIDYYQQALMIAREIGDRRGEGSGLGNLGNAYKNLGEVRPAIEYYQQALAILREIGDRRREGNGLGNLGNAYARLGEVRAAIDYYQQALAIAREIGDRRGESTRLGNLGNAYASLGEVRTAIDYYQQALMIAREIGDRRGEGSGLGNLGIAYADLGEVRAAIDYYQQALAIAREIGDRRGEGSGLGNLGNAYRSLGEVRTAIDYHQQALMIACEIGDRRGEGNSLGNLGIAYKDLGETEKAVESTEAALKIFEEIESPHSHIARRRLEELRGKSM